jgi:hypothetical protein
MELIELLKRDRQKAITELGTLLELLTPDERLTLLGDYCERCGLRHKDCSCLSSREHYG